MQWELIMWTSLLLNILCEYYRALSTVNNSIIPGCVADSSLALAPLLTVRDDRPPGPSTTPPQKSTPTISNVHRRPKVARQSTPPSSLIKPTHTTPQSVPTALLQNGRRRRRRRRHGRRHGLLLLWRTKTTQQEAQVQPTRRRIYIRLLDTQAKAHQQHGRQLCAAGDARAASAGHEYG